MPDTVEVLDPSFGNSRIKPVVNERLVSQQRTQQKIWRPPRMSFQVQRSFDGPKYQPLGHVVKHLDTRPRSPLSNEFKTALYKLLSDHPNGIYFEDFDSHTRRLLGNHYLDEYETSEVLDRIPGLTVCKDGKVYLHKPSDQDRSINQNHHEVINHCSDGSMIDSDEDEERSEYSDCTDFPSVSRPPSRCDKKETPLNDNNDNTCTFVGHNLHNNLRSLFDEPQNANGIWLKKLAEAYQMKHFYPLCPREHGFSSVLDMVANLPHVFYMKQYRIEGDFLLLDARKYSQSPENNDMEKGEIPLSLVKKLTKLLKHEKQIYTEDFESAYKRMYQQSFRPEDYGFENMDGFFHHLEISCEEIIKFRRIVDRTVIKLNYEQKTEPTPSEVALPGVTYDPFPPKVCDGDFRLEADPTFEELKDGDTFLINLGETYTPEHFYITHITRVGLLQDIMTDINDFYESHQEKYIVLPSLVTRGLLCACIYSRTSEWHRAQVVSVTGKTAEILYLDYGTRENRDIGKLRYLHKDFAEHPPLCMRAKLLGIQPKNGSQYHDSASKEFLIQCRNIDLEVKIVHKRAAWLEVLLYTLAGEDRMLVQEHLINKGFVLPKRDGTLSSAQIPTELSETKASNTNTAICTEAGMPDDQTATSSNTEDFLKVGSKNTIEFFSKMVTESNFVPVQRDKVPDGNTGVMIELESPQQKQAWELELQGEQPSVCCFSSPPLQPYTPVAMRSHPDRIPVPANVHVPYHHAPCAQCYCPSYPCYTAGNSLAPNYHFQSPPPLVPNFQFRFDTPSPAPPTSANFQLHDSTHLASNSSFQAGTHVSPNFSAPASSPMPNVYSYTPSLDSHKPYTPPSKIDLSRPPPGFNIPSQWRHASDSSNPRVGVFGEAVDNLSSPTVCSTLAEPQRQETIAPSMKKFLELAIEQHMQKEIWNVKQQEQLAKVSTDIKKLRVQNELESKLKEYLKLSASQDDSGEGSTNRTTRHSTPACCSGYASELISKTKKTTKDKAVYYDVSTSPTSLSSAKTTGTNMLNTNRYPNFWTPSNGGTRNDQLSSLKTYVSCGSGIANASSATIPVKRTGESNLNPIRAFVLRQQKLYNNNNNNNNN